MRSADTQSDMYKTRAPDETYMGHPSLQVAMKHARQNYNKAIREEILVKNL